MLDVQTIVSSLRTLLLYGGADAAKELIKGVVVNGATEAGREASRAWRELMLAEPEVYPLADRVARDPADAATAAELQALLERVLAEHPELRPAAAFTVTTGDISADQGSVGVGVVNGSIITIHNKCPPSDATPRPPRPSTPSTVPSPPGSSSTAWCRSSTAPRP